MTLYFDTKAQFLDGDAISTVCIWHPSEPIFAVSNFHQDRGASVTIFDDTGEPLPDITYPVHGVSQATVLRWHPERRLLVAGWENGELNSWTAGSRVFSTISGPHKGPLLFLEFSEQGGRMVTADAMGILIGWRCDNQGQFLTMFTHDLRDTILNVTFRRTVTSVVTMELNNLAKAAVAGDETALDTLTNWRPRTAARNLSHAGVKDNHCFYVGTQNGLIYYLNQSGTCTEVLRSENTALAQVLWHPKREAIVTLMDDMTVGHFMVESTGTLSELDRVKLSGRVPGHSGIITWAGNSLAILTGDFTVRIWDIDTSDNYLLPMEIKHTTKGLNPIPKIKFPTAPFQNDGGATLTETPGKNARMEVFSCIAYSADSQILCAGTNQGNLYTWKRMVRPTAESSDSIWQLNNKTNVRGAIKFCGWGFCDNSKPCILVNCVSNVYILKEQPLLSTHIRDIWATQRTATEIFVEHSTGRSTLLQSDGTAVSGICINERHFILASNKRITVYKITRTEEYPNAKTKSLQIKATGANFHDNDCIEVFIWDETIIVLGNTEIRFYSLSGVILRKIELNDNEGKPIGANLTHHFLTIFTMHGYIIVYDVSRHEPKMLTSPKSCYDLFANFGEIILAKCNANGTLIAITIATESLIPDGKLYVWNIGREAITEYDFLSRNEIENEDNEPPRVPISFYWDTDDHRLLVCETRTIQKQTPNTGIKSKFPALRAALNDKSTSLPTPDVVQTAEAQANIMFVTSDNKFDLKEMESMNLVPGEKILNLSSPHVITLKYNGIDRKPLCNFIGIETSPMATRSLIIDFSMCVAEGKMDEAFRCIRSIQSVGVWKNLAQMCVKTGRLDVAKVCLGHLNKAVSVRAIRKAMEDSTLEDEAKVAVLAIELDMISDAERLYKKCGRYDLLNELLQACGRFDEALQIAERLDRVHLKNTYYQNAEWLKEQGEVTKALSFYNKSNNAAHNITQMLINDPLALKQFMQATTDSNLLKWWGQYIESTGDMDAAFKVYQRADDWFSQVRILCFLGQLSQADTIARQSGDKSACYHLARHYENISKVQEAIQFYVRAQTYGNAIRICKEHNLPNELWSLAASARSRDKATAAAFFEEIGEYKRAVELYHHSGMLHKAIEMAFASQQPETLQVIAAELDATSDPDLIGRCADFFIQSQQPQKAANLLATAKQYERALEICREHNVPITETLADLLTPVKDDADRLLDDVDRIRILTELGDILQIQGDYHMATKKFTQAGDKVRAMKSLLKSGDTDKIVFFAGMSRQKEVYIMAANYLQSLTWQTDSKILKNIVLFYTKGHAYESLANFYATCAQVEIDDFRDYEKAVKALQEALRSLSKVTKSINEHQHRRAIDNLQSAIVEVRKVMEVQDALERGDYNNVIAVCRSMLTIAERPPVRSIHILAILIESLIKTKQYGDALNSLRELSTKSSDWSYKGLLEKSLIEKLASESGIEFNSIWNNDRKRVLSRNGSYNDIYDNEITEDIQETIE